MCKSAFNMIVLCAALPFLYGGAAPVGGPASDGFVPVEEAVADKYAIVVGIGDYPEESGWNRIHGNRDVELVTGMLVRNGFAEDDIVRLTDAGATKGAIRNAFMSLSGRIKSGDRVYIHFSGHGQQMTDTDGDEEDGLDEACVPYDALKEYSAGKYEGENHISDDELYLWLSDIADTAGADGHVLVVIDACHSGDATRGFGDGQDTVVVRGTADVFVIPQDPVEGTASGTVPGLVSSVEAYAAGTVPGTASGSAGTGNAASRISGSGDKGKEISWICLSACKPYQNNYEYKSPDGYYGRLTWAMSRVLVPGMGVAELISGIEDEFSRLPLPQGPPQSLDIALPDNFESLSAIDSPR